MSGYVKLFGSILQSTVWEEDPEVRCVWITMLALADQNGYVGASVPGLARAALVPRAACERALKKFLAPDKDSRTKNDGGRRIEVSDGGWTILNHAKYRAMDSLEDRRRKDADRQRRFRERHGLTSASRDNNESNPIRSGSDPKAYPDQGSGVGSAPLARPRGKPDRLVAATDAKVAELRAIADKPLTPEEVEALRALRTGAAG